MALEYELATPFFKDPTSYNSLPPRYEVNPNSHKQTSVIYNDLNPINNHMFHINSLRANFFRVNINMWSSDAYMRKWIGSWLVQIMACRLFDAKP